MSTEKEWFRAFKGVLRVDHQIVRVPEFHHFEASGGVADELVRDLFLREQSLDGRNRAVEESRTIECRFIFVDDSAVYLFRASVRRRPAVQSHQPLLSHCRTRLEVNQCEQRVVVFRTGLSVLTGAKPGQGEHMDSAHHGDSLAAVGILVFVELAYADWFQAGRLRAPDQARRPDQSARENE